MSENKAEEKAKNYPAVKDEKIAQDKRAAELLRHYDERSALRQGNFKTLMRLYFEAADEYTAKHGKAPPPVIFNLNGKPATEDDGFGDRDRADELLRQYKEKQAERERNRGRGLGYDR